MVINRKRKVVPEAERRIQSHYVDPQGETTCVSVFSVLSGVGPGSGMEPRSGHQKNKSSGVLLRPRTAIIDSTPLFRRVIGAGQPTRTSGGKERPAGTIAACREMR